MLPAPVATALTGAGEPWKLRNVLSPTEAPALQTPDRPECFRDVAARPRFRGAQYLSRPPQRSYAPRMGSLVIDVRPARSGDAADLANVYALSWREAYSGIIPSVTLERMIVRRGAGWWREALRRRSLLVLDVGGLVVGYASFAVVRSGTHGRHAEVQELYLRPEYQGVGLGSRLFSNVLRRVKDRGYARVLLRALAENDRANGFYERHGGKVIARSSEALGGRNLPCTWYEFRIH